MAGLNKVLGLSDNLARYLKSCGKTSVLQTKPVNPTQIRGLRYQANLTEDIVQINRFTSPNQSRVQQILKQNGLDVTYLRNKCGDVDKLTQEFEGTYISENNLIFIEELNRLFPKEGEKPNVILQNMLIYLQDINHVNYLDKQAFLESFIKDVNWIDNLKAFDGTQLFRGNIVGTYSKKAILDAKYNNPARYKEIMNLYDLHMQGKIPRALIDTLFPKSKFHPLPKDDLTKVIKGQKYYPQYSSSSKPEVVSKALKTGEAFSIGDEMFVKAAEGFEKLRIDKQTYELLFPPIQRYAMAQRARGNCHLIATMDAIVKDPVGRIKFYNMFEQTKDGVRCTIPNLSHASHEFKFKDLSMLNEDIEGALGHRMIEYTYAKHNWIDKGKVFENATTRDIMDEFNFPAHENAISKYIKDFIGENIEKINAGDIYWNGDSYKDLIIRTTKTNMNIANSMHCDPNLGIYESHFFNAGNLKENVIHNPWNTLESIVYSPLELNYLCRCIS